MLSLRPPAELAASNSFKVHGCLAGYWINPTTFVRSAEPDHSGWPGQSTAGWPVGSKWALVAATRLASECSFADCQAARAAARWSCADPAAACWLSDDRSSPADKSAA